MLSANTLRRHLPKWIEEAKAMAPGSPEQAELVKLIRDSKDLADSMDRQKDFLRLARPLKYILRYL